MGNLSPASLSAENSSSTAQQLPSGETEPLRNLTGVVGAENAAPAELNKLVENSNSASAEDLSEGLKKLNDVAQSFNNNDSPKDAEELGDLLGALDYGDLERLLTWLEDGEDSNTDDSNTDDSNTDENLVKLLVGIDDPEVVKNLLDRLDDKSDDRAEIEGLLENLNDDGIENLSHRLDEFKGEEDIEDVLELLADLFRLRGFFNLDELDGDEIDALVDLFDLFDLDELDDDELEELLRLFRFLDLDDLDEFEIDDIESGDVEPSIDIRNTGDNVNLCLGIAQAANSGNVVNQQGVFRHGSEAGDEDFDDDGFFVFDDDHRFGFFDDFDFDDFDFDDRDGDIEFEGSSIEIDSEVDVDCQQAIIQTAAAGRAPSLVRGGAVASAAPVSAAPVSAGVAAPRAVTTAAVTTASSVGGGPAALGLVARPAQLPRTGGLPLTLAVLGLAAIGAGLTLWRYHQR